MCGAAACIALVKSGAVQVLDFPLIRTLTAAALGGLLLAFTVIKVGSYINVISVAEPPLLILAICGAAWSWGHWRLAPLLTTLLAALLAAQIISLLANPGHPTLAARPFARSGLAWTASPAAVNHAVATARRCPDTEAYSGSPYIAFLASRRMPGDQPDLFILQHAHGDAAFAHRAARDRPTCR